MNWLFVTNRFPWPLEHGTHLRVFHLSRALIGQGDSVSLLSRPGPADGADAYAAAGVTLLTGPAGPAPTRGPGRTATAPHVFDAPLAESLQSCAGDFDTIVLVREKTLQYSPEARTAATVLVDVIDDPVREHNRPGANRGGISGWLRRRVFTRRQGAYERRFGLDVDRCVFVSPVDAESFSARSGYNAVCIPNGVDTDYFSAGAVDAPTDTGDVGVVFTGNLAYEPNDQAARFLIEHVAPRLWRACPEATFIIVGPDPSEALQALAGERVTVTGYVPDVRPYLKAAAVVSAPMRTGTGIKNKLLEAWSMGCGVVATSLACSGLAATDGENVLVADSADAHAEAIGRLIADQPQRDALGASGRQTVLTQYTWEGAAEQFRLLRTRG